MPLKIFLGYEIDLLMNLDIALAAGFVIGAERESRNKAAGISTHYLVIGGAMIFTFLSSVVDPNSLSRIAAQIITGVGFIGAGLTLMSETDDRITNLTTAAAVRFAASIGMAIGYPFYFLAVVVTVFAVGVPRIPRISKMIKKDEETCPWRLSRTAKEICYPGCLDCAPAYQL